MLPTITIRIISIASKEALDSATRYWCLRPATRKPVHSRSRVAIPKHLMIIMLIVIQSEVHAEQQGVSCFCVLINLWEDVQTSTNLIHKVLIQEPLSLYSPNPRPLPSLPFSGMTLKISQQVLAGFLHSQSYRNGWPRTEADHSIDSIFTKDINKR